MSLVLQIFCTFYFSYQMFDLSYLILKNAHIKKIYCQKHFFAEKCFAKWKYLDIEKLKLKNKFNKNLVNNMKRNLFDFFTLLYLQINVIKFDDSFNMKS